MKLITLFVLIAVLIASVCGIVAVDVVAKFTQNEMISFRRRKYDLPNGSDLSDPAVLHSTFGGRSKVFSSYR